MANRDKKVLLIGASGYGRSKDGARIDSFEWSEIHKIANLRDYDVVIFSLLTLKTPEQRAKVNWGHFRTIANFSAAIDVPYNNGMIITIGDPRFEINWNPQSKATTMAEPFLDWSGINFSWDGTEGDTIAIEVRQNDSVL